MKNNNQTNNLIKWSVIIMDFVAMNALLIFFRHHHVLVDKWPAELWHVFLLGSNMAMIFAQSLFSTIIHQRLVSASDITKRVFLLALTQNFASYVILRALDFHSPVGRILALLGPMMLILLLLLRSLQRLIVKRFRHLGRNTRYVTFVGNDPELLHLYQKLLGDTTKGYKFLGYYADDDFTDLPEGVELERLGTLQGFLKAINNESDLFVGDEIYVSISRKQRQDIRKISHFCDSRLVRFYYVPVSVETLGMDLKREFLDDMEVFTTYELPLRNSLNRIIKRTFDIIVSSIALLCLIPVIPIIWIIVKIQSPGPLLFKQLRTGLDGKNFYCYKFRSMHVNDDADKVQATKDDPRKYAFGNFMRKANIDELPQFWNVLIGNMSVVGPRPHMLAHTEMYSQLIGKYMVRHFAKPGVTGWAQVTGFRGETKELWQMEGRVQRDIWYIEHWSFWLDLRIIWLTFKSVFVHDEHAY